MTDLYRVLGVGRRATADRITKAYRKLAMKYHPDRNIGDDAAKEQYALVHLAYEVLSDDSRRAQYDATGETAAPKVNQALAEIAAVLSGLFVGIVESIVNQGGDVARENIVDHMRKAVATHLKNLKKVTKEVTTLRAALETALPRLALAKGDDDKEDVITGAGRAHLAVLARRLTMIEDEERRFGKALEFLKAYSYRVDAAKDTSFFGTGFGNIKLSWDPV